MPRVEDTPEPAEPGTALAELPGGSGTILLVEDEEGVRDLAREILELHGYAVLEAHHPGKALLISQEHAGPIHLLVTDVIMPEMSGRALADRLERARPEMKVLLMSGYTDDAVVHRGVLNPGTAFVQKPFAPETLLRRVREALDGPRAR